MNILLNFIKTILLRWIIFIHKVDERWAFEELDFSIFCSNEEHEHIHSVQCFIQPIFRLQDALGLARKVSLAVPLRFKVN